MSEQPTEKQVIAMLKRILEAGEILAKATAVKLETPAHHPPSKKVANVAPNASASAMTTRDSSTLSPKLD